jgi:hypothetical protein
VVLREHFEAASVGGGISCAVSAVGEVNVAVANVAKGGGGTVSRERFEVVLVLNSFTFGEAFLVKGTPSFLIG